MNYSTNLTKRKDQMSTIEKIIALEKALSFCQPISLSLWLRLHKRIGNNLN